MASLASRVEHPNTNNIPLTLASLQLHTREPLVITDQRLESDSKVQGMRSNGDDRQSICKSRREWMSRHQVRNHWRESGIERITYSKSLLDWCSWLMSKCLLHCSSLHLLFFLNIPLKLNRTDCFTWICWKMKAISFWSWTPIGELESMDCMSLWKSIAVKDIPWDVLFRCLVYLRVELPLLWRCIDLMSSWEFSISFSLFAGICTKNCFKRSYSSISGVKITEGEVWRSSHYSALWSNRPLWVCSQSYLRHPFGYPLNLRWVICGKSAQFGD